jgi:hypothetical protein
MGGDVKVALELFEVCVVEFHFGGSICKVLQFLKLMFCIDTCIKYIMVPKCFQLWTLQL